MKSFRNLAILLTLFVSLGAFPFRAFAACVGNASDSTCSNTDGTLTLPISGIQNNQMGPANHYPSVNTVSGMTGTISAITVNFTGFTHGAAQDSGWMLVAPDGVTNLVFMSNTGGGGPSSNLTLHFSDSGVAQVAYNAFTGMVNNTTYLPTSNNPDGGGAQQYNVQFPSPAPTPSFAAPRGSVSHTFAGTFNSLTGAAINGTWKLYAVQECNCGDGPTEQITGWSIRIQTAAAAAPTTTSISGTPNPSFATAPNNTVTITATVQSGGSAVPVGGTVTFKDGSTTIPGCAAVSTIAAGTAVCITTFATEGTHTITAAYSGFTGFTASNNSYSQFVDTHTTSPGGGQYCNPGAITLPSTNSPASVYPSHIYVPSGLGSISKVTMQLKGVTSIDPSRIEMLLVSPDGTKFVPFEQAAQNGAITNLNFSLDDAGVPIPSVATLTSQAYAPTAFTPIATFTGAPTPATADFAQPVGGATFLSKFSGANPNGSGGNAGNPWSLYMVTGTSGATSSVGSGWCLTFNTSSDPASTTSVTSSLNPAFTSSSVTFTATVTSGGNTVTVGTVTFKEGSTVLQAPVAVNGAGKVTYSSSTLSEGVHTITAFYSGVPGSFNVSNGSIAEVVNTPTAISGTQYCNPGTISVPSAAAMASVYPSRIFVSNLPGVIGKVTVNLKGYTKSDPSSVDTLLVGPQTNANTVFMSEVGALGPVNNLTMTIDDTGVAMPATGQLTSQLYKPTAFNSLGFSFPAPLPVDPSFPVSPNFGATLASQFNGKDGNGTWELYTYNDLATGVGAFNNGWCLNFTETPPVLSITKSHTGNFRQGDVGDTYTLHVTNSGVTGPTGGTVTVTEVPPPSGMTVTAMSGTNWTCTVGTLTCTRSDALAQGASYDDITVTVTIANAATTPLVNKATVSGGGTAAPVNSNNDSTVVNPASDLTISNVHNGTLHEGDIGDTFTITVTNSGAGATTSQTLTVTVNPTVGLTATGLSGTGWTCVVATLTCTRSDVQPGGFVYPAITMTVNVAGNAPSTVASTANVSGGGQLNTSNDSSTDNASVVQVPDLTVSQPAHSAVQQGQLGVTFPITVSNAGGGATSGTVTVTAALSAGLTATAFSGSGWTCANLPTLSCTRSDVLGASASYPVLTVTASVASNAGASVSSTAAVSGGGETNTTNDSSAVNAAVGAVPDLTIVKTNSPTNFTQGQNGATYTLTVTNSGGGPTAGTVTVVDTLPAGLTATALSGTGWTCTLGTLTCTRADVLAASASYPNIALTVNVSSTAPSSVVNIATVSGGGEVNTLNDGATDPTIVLQVTPSMVITTAGTPQTAHIGTAFPFALQAIVKDNSNNPVSGVTVTFTAPASGASGAFQGGTNVVTANTGVNGVATASTFTANAQTGTYTVVATIPGASAAFSLTNDLPANPTADSASDSITGSTHVLTLNYSSPTGFASLVDTYVLLNNTFNITKGCWVYYDQAANGFFLVNDAATALLGPVPPGSGSQSNSQCTLNGAGSSVSGSVNTLTMTVSVTFLSGFSASESIFMYAATSGLNSGWNYRGTTSAVSLASPTADSVSGSVAIAPSSGALTLQYSSPNGFGNLADVYALMNNSFDGIGACWVFWDKSANAFYLVSDSGAALIGPLAVGSSSNISNSQCTLKGSGSSVSGSGNTLTMTLNLSFSTAFGNGKTVYMYAADQSGQSSGWQTRGSTSSIVAAAPTSDTVTGTGATANQTLTLQYSSVNGYGYLADAYVFINATSAQTNACWAFYDKPSNGFFLVNDGATALIGPLPLGSNADISNSQCTLHGTGSSISGSGNTLTMVLSLTLNHSFAGGKTVQMNVADDSATFSGWVSRGTLTVP